MSDRDDVRDLLFRLPFSRSAASRFVAGDKHEDALTVATELNRQGYRVTLDLLGESVSERAEAERATAEYSDSLELIEQSEASTTISLKLTQLGLDISTEFCTDNLRHIVG
ncbi:MAG: proline dehydrogenase, partial [Gemmatimonadota bacterium]